MKEKYLIIWPKSKDVTHINYHFSQFGEYVSYLNRIFPRQILYRDGDIPGKLGYEDNEEILNLIKSENIGKIVMQITYENAGHAQDLIEEIKKYSSNIAIMGYGTIPRLYPDLFKEIPIDVLASSGHDQKCIETFLREYDYNNELESLPGLKIKSKTENQFVEGLSGLYLESDEWTYTPKELSQAYYEENNHARYVLNVSTGCPFNCEHCLLQLTEGKKERRRTIESIDETLTNLNDEFPYVEFFAANLTLDQEYVLNLCEMMKRKHPNITWGCATRIDEVTRKKGGSLIMDDSELLKVMNDAGCTLIGLGVEGVTGNLNSIHTKDFVFEKTNQAIKNIEDAGIVAKAMIMLRIPHQTRQDIINTFYYLTKMNTYIRPTIYTPYHKIDKVNTKLYDLYRYNRKKIPDDLKSPVEGISNNQFNQLLKCPSNYLDILKCTQEELSFADNITNIEKQKVLVRK